MVRRFIYTKAFLKITVGSFRSDSIVADMYTLISLLGVMEICISSAVIDHMQKQRPLIDRSGREK